jgi:hypothetical protein
MSTFDGDWRLCRAGAHLAPSSSAEPDTPEQGQVLDEELPRERRQGGEAAGPPQYLVADDAGPMAELV